MDLNVLGFNQEKVLKIKNIKTEKRKNTEKEITQTLGIDDLYILNRLFNFRGSLKTINKIIDNKVFFWISYKTLLESMPILDITTDSLGRRFKKYEEMGLIERSKENEANGKKGCFSFIHITVKLEDLRTNENLEMRDEQGNDYGDNKTKVPALKTETLRRQQAKASCDDIGTKNIKEIKGKEKKEKERKTDINSIEKVKVKLKDVLGQSVENPQILDSKVSKISALVVSLGLEKVMETLDKIKENKFLMDLRKKKGDLNFLNYILGLEKFTDIAFGAHDPFKKDDTLSAEELKQCFKEEEDSWLT